MAAAIAAAIAALLYLLLYRTRIGKAIRAVSANRAAAELSGIPTSQMLALSFGLGVTLRMRVGDADRDVVSFHGTVGRGLSA